MEKKSDQNRWNFPTDNDFVLMVRVLNLRKGDQMEGLAPYLKTRITKKFQVEKNFGKDVIREKVTKRKLLKRSEYQTAFEQFHGRGHIKSRNTWKRIEQEYYKVPLPLIQKSVNNCHTCQTRKPLPQPTRGKAMVAYGVWDRVHIDLFNMEANQDMSDPEAPKKQILHLKDHLTKFTIAYALKSKSAAEVIEKVRDCFYQFGPPKILFTDNGGKT